MLRCEECGCVSDTARYWLAFVAALPDDDEPPEFAAYCPPCADREIRPVRHAAGYE